MFTSRIPDPAQRQQAVNTLIQSQGLPQVLSGPVNLYTEQITLNRNISATVGLVGARNSLFLTMYQTRSQPISGSGSILPPLIAGENDNTQTGASVVWSHKLTPITTANLNATSCAPREMGPWATPPTRATSS